MNKLHDFFSYLGFDEDEIAEILLSCPGLKIRNVDTVIKCASTLTALGFPRSELYTLITLNPNFLLGEPEHIRKVVSSIDGDIIETILKNPYII